MKTTALLTFITFLFCNEVLSQKVKDEDLTFKYKRLPSHPLDKNIKTYSGQVLLAYAEEDKKKLDEYEQKKQTSQEQYTKDKKSADEKYEKEKKEYKEKSFEEKFLDKVVLGENNKPQREHVGKEGLEKPYIRKTFDTNLLSSTYVKLEGYQKSESADVLVTFTAHGVEWHEPKTNESSYTSIGGSNAGQSQKQYTAEIKYRSPVSVRVETADGTTILNEIVEKTNEYRYWTSSRYSSTGEALGNADPKKIIPSHEQKILEDNMKIASEYLNNKCAVSVTERKTILYNVESKKVSYTDFQEAYLAAAEGYTLMAEVPEEAMSKIRTAITAWEKALKESNPRDKKARVNEEITTALVFNLAEAYMWTNEFGKAKLTIAKASTLDLSRKESQRIDELKRLIEDMQQRYEANKGI